MQSVVAKSARRKLSEARGGGLKPWQLGTLLKMLAPVSNRRKESVGKKKHSFETEEPGLKEGREAGIDVVWWKP